MAKETERRLDRDGVGLDLQQLVDRLELLVDTARRFRIAITEDSDHRLDPPDADDVRLEVSLDLLEPAPSAGAVVIRMLDRPGDRDLGRAGNGFHLDVAPGGTDEGDEPVGGSLDVVLREFADALALDRPVEPDR